MWWCRIGSKLFKKFALETKLGLRFFGSSASSKLPVKRIAALWGNGDFGRLGSGGLKSHSTPIVCSTLKNESLCDIACGGAHTLFLTESGRVYATGLNDFGQLGISEDTRYTTEPVEVYGFPNEVVHISAGSAHSSAVSVDGKLYMWGKNSNGQLGLGKRAANLVFVPRKVDCLDGFTITMSALGFEHSVAVTEQGQALSWGDNRLGKLGHEDESGIWGFFKSKSEYTPRLISKLARAKVKNISAGMMHTACIDENGSVFLFGEGLNKFGFSEEMTFMVLELPESREVACGGYHTCALTNDGELYIWGLNESGCLGSGNASYVPQKVQRPLSKYPICKVSCGWKHSAIISGGKIFTWGWGGGNEASYSDEGDSSGGQLGQGNELDYYEPTMVKFACNMKAVQVSCGFNHTGAILEYA